MKLTLFSAPLFVAAAILAGLIQKEAAADEIYRCGRVYTNRPCPNNQPRRPVTGTFSRSTANSAEVRARMNPQFMDEESAAPAPRRTRSISPSPQTQDRPPNIGELSIAAARLKAEIPDIQSRDGTMRAQTEINRLRGAVDIACAPVPSGPDQYLCRSAMDDLQSAFQMTQDK